MAGRRSSPSGRRDRLVRALLERHGHTFADDAGITVANRPSNLFQLLVLALLLSARINADIAVSASRALRKAGWTTPRKMVDGGWAARAKVLNESGYARYDERTSRMLEESARLLLERYSGDLRRLRADTDGDVGRLRARLLEFTGIGGVGVDIFCREAQETWDELRPYVDDRARDAAKALGLPSSPRGVAGLVPEGDLTRLVAALVRCRIAGDADEIKAAASG